MLLELTPEAIIVYSCLRHNQRFSKTAANVVIIFTRCHKNLDLLRLHMLKQNLESHCNKNESSYKLSLGLITATEELADIHT